MDEKLQIAANDVKHKTIQNYLEDLSLNEAFILFKTFRGSVICSKRIKGFLVLRQATFFFFLFLFAIRPA